MKALTSYFRLISSVRWWPGS